MIHGSDLRHVLLFDRVTSDTSTTNGGNAIDTRGYAFAHILFWEESTGGTATAKVLQVEEGDTTSSCATFAGARGGTDFTNIAVASAAQSTIPYMINVNCLGRKRYLRLKWTPGATGFTASGIAILSRPSVTPLTTTEQGVGLIANA